MESGHFTHHFIELAIQPKLTNELVNTVSEETNPK